MQHYNELYRTVLRRIMSVYIVICGTAHCDYSHQHLVQILVQMGVGKGQGLISNKQLIKIRLYAVLQ